MVDLSAADENYALAITSGDASSSSISPYPADLRVCSGSYNEAGTNRIDVLGIDPELIADPEAYAREYYNNEEEYDSTSGDETIPDRKQDLVKLASQKIRYPPTKVAFGPPDLVHHPTFEAGSEFAQIVAATTDSLRIYKLKEASTESKFSQQQTYSQHVGRENRRSKAELAKLVTLKEDASGEGASASECGISPLTSFDWCTVDKTRIVTSSTRNTCTLWDLQEGKSAAAINLGSQVHIEICDVAWQPGCTSTFIAGTSHCTLHLLDIRQVNKDRILYKPSIPSGSPPASNHSDLLDGRSSHAMARVAFNPADPNMVACLQLNDYSVRLVDIRNPGFWLAKLTGHQEHVNGFSWRSNSPSYDAGTSEGFGTSTLASVGDDCRVLLWNANAIGEAGQSKTHVRPSLLTKGKQSIYAGSPSAVCDVPDPIENVAWGVSNDYLAISMGSRIRIMRI